MFRPNTIAPRSAALACAFLAVVAATATAQPASATRSYAGGCTRTVSTPIGGVQTVGPGEMLCLRGATVEGAINVAPGGSLGSWSSTVNGAITLSGAEVFVLCDTIVVGDISATNGTERVSVGDNHACGGSDVTGAVTVSHTAGGVRLAGNAISGAVTVNANATGAAAGPRIAGNAIGGALSCAGNAPKPTNTGRVNTVVGARSGQCIAPGFRSASS